MANRIATETYAKNIGGSGTATANKCCTATRASALGCNTGSYSGKRLVPQNALSKAEAKIIVTLNVVSESQYASVHLFANNATPTNKQIQESPMISDGAQLSYYPSTGLTYTITNTTGDYVTLYPGNTVYAWGNNAPGVVFIKSFALPSASTTITI